jgi:hypothetical protein
MVDSASMRARQLHPKSPPADQRKTIAAVCALGNNRERMHYDE